jgi:hypothetical protein
MEGLSQFAFAASRQMAHEIISEHSPGVPIQKANMLPGFLKFHQ